MTTYYERYTDKLKRGHYRESRGLATRSLNNATFAVKAGRTYQRDGSNPLIGFVEGCQFIAGTFDKADIERVAPNARLDLFTAQSAYGPRVGRQLDRVVEKLIEDKHTRQAVITLATPEEELAERPCTSTLQFLRSPYHDKVMNTIVTMRSSDAVWGLPYDLIQFGMFAGVVAAACNLYASNIIINIADAHIYEQTMDKVKNVTAWEFRTPEVMFPRGLPVRLYKEIFADLSNKITKKSVKDLFCFRQVEYDG